MSTRVFVEGGGDTRRLKAECRRAFSEFFQAAGLKGPMPKVVACGGRRQAFDSFRHEVARAPSDSPMLLVDSEGPLVGDDAWSHLQQSDNWRRPEAARIDSAHVMVQVMESWFLADKRELADYFGQRFVPNALPQGTDIEDIRKDDVLDGLKKASRRTTKRYKKGRDSFEILRRLDASLVTAACPHAKWLIDALQG